MQCSKFALFLGDLSMHCNEADLEEAFSPYGTILEIRVKRSKETAKTLSYGFLEFASASSAVNAMNDMDGVVLKGRPLRIRWAASKKNPVRKRDIREDLHERISMHVKFMSYKIDKIITEELLRNLFSIYGEVCDTTIKQISVDRKSHRLKGYGFVSYYNDEAGCNAAQRALTELHDSTLDDITYKCELSNILEAAMTQPYSPHTGPGAMHPHALGMAMPGLNSFGELDYDAAQQQGTYFDDYSPHFTDPSHYGTHQSSFDGMSVGGFERSPAGPMMASSPGAFGRSVSGNGSLLLSTHSSTDRDTTKSELQSGSPSSGGLELRPPSRGMEDGNGALSLNGSGNSTPLSARTPGADLLGPNFLPLPPHGGHSVLAPRPMNPASRPYPLQHQHSAPPFVPAQQRYNGQVQGQGQGHSGYRDTQYGQYLPHQHSAPEGSLNYQDPMMPTHLRRSHSGPQHQQLPAQSGYGGQPSPGYPTRYANGYGNAVQGKPGGNGRYAPQQAQYQVPQQPMQMPYGQSGHNQNAGGTRPPIYARTSPTLQQQQQQLQLQQLAQQYAQRDLIAAGYDLGASTTPRQPPSPGGSRGLYEELSLDVLSPDLVAPLGQSTKLTGADRLSPSTGPSLLAGLSLGSSSGEPFPLRDLSRSGSSHSSNTSIFGQQPLKPSALAVNALGGSPPSASQTLGVAAELSQDPHLWLPSNFDLPQM